VEINGDSLNDINNSHVSAETSLPVPPEGAFTSQHIVLRKHLIWAGAADAIAIAVVVAVVILVGGGNISVPVAIYQPPSIPPSNAPPPTPAPPGAVTPLPLMVATTEAPTDEALFVTADSEIKLLASDGATEDYFGQSVAIDGETIVIGSSGDNSGSAYVYIHSGTVWTDQAKLTANDGAATAKFGESVAINGHTIVIGAAHDSIESGPSSGSAYAFTRSGTGWTEQVKLIASDGVASDFFGRSVAIYEDTIVIGALFDDDNGSASGSVYVYTRSETVWTEQAKLTASDGAEQDFFGTSVAINGDTIVIGAYNDDTENVGASGSAYVYTRSGTVWTEQVKLIVHDGSWSDQFGKSVAIDADTIVIGKEGDSSAYVYTHVGTAWTEQAKLTALFAYFDTVVAIDGDTIAIGAYADDTDNGANSGSAYVYTRSGTVWTEQAKLTASDGAENDGFGISVAIDGNTIVIGAHWDDNENGISSGSAYTYIISPTHSPMLKNIGHDF